MHFKNLIIITSGLATLASAGTIPQVVDTIANIPIVLVDTLVNGGAGTKPTRPECTKEELDKAFELELDNLDVDLFRISLFRSLLTVTWFKFQTANMNTIQEAYDRFDAKVYNIEEAPASMQPPLAYRGPPTTCKKLKDMTVLNDQVK
ncbi:hypothetical protein C0992_007399, partial [Termitomyces sp. T32_za158]